jgi:hypothetical protein
MDYARLAAKGNTLLKKYGVSMKLTRDGTSVGSGFGMFVQKESADETTSVSSTLAQTSLTARSLLFSGTAKAPLVGDVLAADKETWKVQRVEVIRPAATTLLYKLEVM